MAVVLPLSAFAAIITTAECYCRSETLYANTFSASKGARSSQHEYCTYDIRPEQRYSWGGYLLEISWPASSFNIKGNMPFCKENFIEVSLTRSYQSIGKFCSSNAGSPQKMYAKGGYAKISYSNNGNSSSLDTFQFYYKMVDNATAALGGIPGSPTCDNTNNYADSGVIYSTSWPLGYLKSSSSCEYMIEKSSLYQGVYVFFMDINMSPSDCVQLFGSNVSSVYYEISRRLCGKHGEHLYTTYNKNLMIAFDRRNGANTDYSGLLVGYVMFRVPTIPTTSPPTSAPTSTPKISSSTPTDVTTSWSRPADVSASSSSNTLVVVLSITVPMVVIIIIEVAVLVVCIKRRRKQSITNYQPLKIAPAMPHKSCEFSQSKLVPPTATMQVGNHLNNSYPIGHVVRASSNDQKSIPGTSFSQFSTIVAPTNSSMPAGALLPPLHQGAAVLDPSTRSFNFGDADNRVIPPVGVSTNVTYL